MDQQEQQRLAEIMSELATGDLAGVVALYLEFGDRVTVVVRRQLRRLHADSISRDDLDGLVIDACFAIGEAAGGWHAGRGAAPWSWAERRVGNVVARFVGQHADELDARLELPAEPHGVASEADPLALLGRADLPICRLLTEAIDTVPLSERDRRLLFELELQAQLGDPSPAATVAQMFGMRPPAVRQAVKRAKDRLRRLAVDEERFEPLADLALLA